MSKVEIFAFMVVSFALIAVCHGQDGWLFEAGMLFSGVLLGAVMWVVLNITEENEDAE